MRIMNILFPTMLIGLLNLISLAPATATTPPTQSAPVPAASIPSASVTIAPLEARSCMTSKSVSACNGDLPLMLDTLAVRLPQARVGKVYRHQVNAYGGVSPYAFQIAGGKLPEGMQLSASGLISGTPVSRDQQRFTVQASDHGGQLVQQSYMITVLGIATDAKPKPASAVSAPAPEKPLTVLSASEAKTPLPPITQLDVYQVTPDLIKSIADPKLIIQPEDVVTQLNSDGRAQMKQLLAPLLGVEYPSRRLFAAALDAQVCNYSADLVRAAALKQNISTSKEAALEKVCPTTASPPPVAASPVVAPPVTAPVSIDKLPAAVLPKEWREFVINGARHSVKIDTLSVPGWEGEGCNCLTKSTTGTIYGFYPGWHADAKRPTVDFGVYDRVSLFAQMIDGDGNVIPLTIEDAPTLKFLHEVHAHGSELDITLYQGDWRFLRSTSEMRLNWAIQQIASQALRQADRNMPGWQGAWQRWLPGDKFGEVERVADGVTLYLTPPDDKDLKLPFAKFRSSLILQLIKTLRASPYPHTLNVMIDDTDLVSSTANMAGKDHTANPGSSQLGTADLFNYLVAAEDPAIVGGHIVPGTGANANKSNTSVTLRFVVLLAEPVASSSKHLRRVIEADPVLTGINQKTVLRKLIPLVSVGSGGREQFKDNLAYFVDNYGGVALWQPPVNLPVQDTAPASASAKDKPVPTMVSELVSGLRATFLADEPAVSAACSFTCEWHLPLRALFFMLFFVGLVSVLLYQVCCRIRAIGKPYKLYLLGGCVLTLIIGQSLLKCDPGLQTLRENNNILFAVLGCLLLFALIPLLKPRVEKP